MADLSALSLVADATGQLAQTPKLEAGNLKVGLIDFHRFSRDCLTDAIEKHDPHIELLLFDSVDEFIAGRSPGLDLVVYYPHSCDPSEEVIARDVRTMRQASPGLPIVVLSDVEEAHQPKTIHNTLSSGARGFIPTRTTGVPIVVAAIRFIKAGGTFAPIDQILNNQTTPTPVIPCAEPQVPLTARQMEVLSHLRQGKATKIIAYELNMSESTVKVHIRNIMRKMGATNRTEAAYKAQQLWNSLAVNKASDFQY
jgi:DNA-binding NarL/FixJ family response regulator